MDNADKKGEAEAIIIDIDRKEYTEGIVELLKRNTGKTVCYVSLNKTASVVSKALSRLGWDENNLFVIDAVSDALHAGQEGKNILFLSSPAALTEMGIAISEVLKSGKFDILIFDCLNTLSIFRLGDRAEKFIVAMMNKVHKSNTRAYFVNMQPLDEVDIIKSAYMGADKCFKIEPPHDARTSAKVAVIGAAVMLTGYFAVEGANITGHVTGYSAGVVEGEKKFSILAVLLMGVCFCAIAYYVTQMVISLEPLDDAKLRALKNRSSMPKSKVQKAIRNKMRHWK